MDKNKILRALKQTHDTEKSFLRPDGKHRDDAAKQAAKHHELDQEEREILFRALHVEEVAHG